MPGVSAVPLMDLMLRVSLSWSVSPSNKSRVTGVPSSSMVNISSSATGGLFCPFIVMVTVAVSVPPWPSLMV